MTLARPFQARAAGAAMAVVAVLVLAGCAAPPPPSTSGPGEPPGSEPVASAPPAGSVDGADLGTPPDATLSVEGGDPVTGQLGTYTWAGGGSDSPWLPGSPIPAGRGETLTVSLTADPGMTDWSAVLTRAGSSGPENAAVVGAGPAPMDVVAPGPGSWTLAVTVEFGDLGSATWFWLLEVS